MKDNSSSSCSTGSMLLLQGNEQPSEKVHQVTLFGGWADGWMDKWMEID